MMKRIVLIATLCAIALTGCDAKVCDCKVKILEKYPHDKDAYTQGLFFWKGDLYETTGQWGKSSVRKVELRSGKVLKQKNFDKKYFAEGSCVVDGMLYILTWTNKVAFVYDASNLEYKMTYSYPREGWGLVSIPEDYSDDKAGNAVMVASDGSANLYWLDKSMRTLKTLTVTLDGRPVRLLNELEWIDGKIWANIYTTDIIVTINPENGHVENKIDCSDLMPAFKRTPEMDVLNGIAQGPDGSIYLTGKNWPYMFKVCVSSSSK